MKCPNCDNEMKEKEDFVPAWSFGTGIVDDYGSYRKVVIHSCKDCANATEDFNNDIDNGCYMCSKGIEDNYKPNVAKQIKSAISIIENEKECVQSGVFCDRDCANCKLVKEDSEIIGAFDVAIRSLNAWEEVLQELEHDKEICFAHDSDEGFVYARAIDIIKSKLEGVTGNG